MDILHAHVCCNTGLCVAWARGMRPQEPQHTVTPTYNPVQAASYHSVLPQVSATGATGCQHRTDEPAAPYVHPTNMYTFATTCANTYLYRDKEQVQYNVVRKQLQFREASRDPTWCVLTPTHLATQP